MIEDDGVVFTNLNGISWEFNNNTWALKEFDAQGSLRGTRVDRMEEPGEWPTRTLPGPLIIHTGGDLNCGTVEEYVEESMGMVNTLVPAGVIELERRMGTIAIKYYGLEWLVADCAIDDFPHLPKQALYPTVSDWSVSYRVFAGYMVGRTSGRPYSLV